MLPGFGAAVERKELPQLKLLRDPDRTIGEQLIASGLMQAAIASLGPDFSEACTTRMLEQAGIPKQ